MAVTSTAAFRTRLRDGGEWEPVAEGESAAGVFRSADRSRYAKCVPAGHVASLEAERDRTDWLRTQGVPGPRVLDWRVDAAGAARETWADDRRSAEADETFARRYGTVLDRDRERFYLHLDPLTWG